MKIDWLGHSCFRLTESTGTTIITDPYDPEQLGCAFPVLTADAVTCSHHHPNHDHVSAVGGNPLILDRVGTFDVKGVHIESIPTARAAGNRNLVFRYRMDGVDICHLGDIGGECTPELIEEISPIDILMIPIGGNGHTLDAEAAIRYIELLMPEIVVPMHYRMDDCDNDYDFDTLKDFLRLFEDENVSFLKEGQPLVCERDDFMIEGTKIVVPSRLIL